MFLHILLDVAQYIGIDIYYHTHTLSSIYPTIGTFQHKKKKSESIVNTTS